MYRLFERNPNTGRMEFVREDTDLTSLKEEVRYLREMNVRAFIYDDNGRVVILWEG